MVGEKGLSPEAADRIGEYVQLHGEHGGMEPLSIPRDPDECSCSVPGQAGAGVLGAGTEGVKQHTQLAGPIVAGAAVLADVRHDLFLQVRHDLFPQVAWT